MHRPLLIGHRGMRGKFTENERDGFLHAQISPAVSGVEFDVQLTDDGKLAVFHDETLDRLFGKQTRIDDLSSCRLPPRMLLLDDMPALLDGFLHIELEIKTHLRTNYPNLIHALDKTWSMLEHLAITLTSFDRQLLQMLDDQQKLRTAKRGLLVEHPNDLDDCVFFAKQAGCCQIGFWHTLLTADVIQNCHRSGLGITAWTVNNPAQAKKLASLGVDAIISDIADEILPLI